MQHIKQNSLTKLLQTSNLNNIMFYNHNNDMIISLLLLLSAKDSIELSPSPYEFLHTLTMTSE